MKCINHEDLCKLLSTYGPTESWCIDDLNRLLDTYGDDYFAVGEQWELCNRNKNMEKFLKELSNNA